jgi:membrane protein implicated in regulation of membrane protease activity
LGFGIAAIVTGALIAMGLSVGLAQLLLIYAVLSLISWLLLRRFLQQKSGSVKTFDQDIND